MHSAVVSDAQFPGKLSVSELLLYSSVVWWHLGPEMTILGTEHVLDFVQNLLRHNVNMIRPCLHLVLPWKYRL